MRDTIEKLLILQDRDRKIMRTRDQLARIEPERQLLQEKAGSTQAGFLAAKLRVQEIESHRKDLELEVQGKKQLIEKYALQQFQTKKNEEYRALAHEMDTCREAIVKLEDKQLEYMEQAEAAQKQVVVASREADEMKKLADGQLKDLAAREINFKAELAGLESNREELTSSIDGTVLNRYQRLLINKGENVVVGINHGVCGGCHMKFPVQLVVSCQAEKELVCCPNCNRILYYTRDMDMAVAE